MLCSCSELPGQLGLVKGLAMGVFEEVGIDLTNDVGWGREEYANPHSTAWLPLPVPLESSLLADSKGPTRLAPPNPRVKLLLATGPIILLTGPPTGFDGKVAPQ